MRGSMFNGIWLVASEQLTIHGREVQVGERFQVSRIRSGALLVMGRAGIAHPQSAPTVPDQPAPRRRGRPRKLHTTDIAADTSDTPETDEAHTRQYRRRDLEAEP